MLRYEKEAWAERPGVVIAGVDEAGRGCLAGPVVAGAVTMALDLAESLYVDSLAGLTDSKQLCASRRETFYDILTATPGVVCATGWCSAAEVDRLNILAATSLAMRRALEALPEMPGLALVDGLPVKRLPCASVAIVQGDAKSFLIAAASVVAKVSRDRYMVRVAERYRSTVSLSTKGTASMRTWLRSSGMAPVPSIAIPSAQCRMPTKSCPVLSSDPIGSTPLAVVGPLGVPLFGGGPGFGELRVAFLFDEFLVERLDAEARGVGNRDEAVLDKRFRQPGH